MSVSFSFLPVFIALTSFFLVTANVVGSSVGAARPIQAGPSTGVPLIGAPAGKIPQPEKGLMRLSGEYVEFSHKQRIVVIKGSAYVEFGDLKFWAQNIQGDMAHNQIYAHGKVVFWQGKEKMSGEFLSYNYKTKKGHITNLLTKRGPNFVRA